MERLADWVLARWAVVFSADTGMYVLGIGIVLGLEVVLLGWRASSMWRLCHPSGSTWTDLALWGAKVLGLSGLLATVFSLGLADLGLRAVRLVHAEIGFANPHANTLFVFLAMDFAKYGMHVLQHKIPFWWQGHKFHHAATEFNVITTARGHPSDHALQLVFPAVPAALLNATVDQFVFLTVLLHVHGGLTHSMLPWDFGWFGRWVLVSPLVHRVHHSAEPIHHDRNFGAVLVIWDRIFGTYYNGTEINERLDVAGNPYNRDGVLRDLLACPVRMLRGDGAARQD